MIYGLVLATARMYVATESERVSTLTKSLVAMTRITAIVRLLLVSACTAVAAAVALRAQSDSPCNQGRAIAPAIDPRNEQATCFPELGRMIGTINQCKSSGTGEEFGNRIASVGKLSDSGLACWVVSRQRCDTAIGVGSTGRYPLELLLYRGVRGGLPSVESGERIGPSEIGSITTFLAAGDWDGDGNRDIATRIQLYNDTSSGNIEGYDIARLVIFWGNPQEIFSLEDTTQLASDADLWIGIGPAISGDFNEDGVDDLLVSNSSGFTDGHVVPQSYIHLFEGHHHQRWGTMGLASTADWRWWNVVESNNIRALDQDGDGAMDVALYHNTSAGTGSLTVLYGHPAGGLPDTTEAETTDLLYANGHYSLFSDVTGDGIPELVTSCGSEDRIKVFIGLRGQRLKEQYGDGHEGEHPGEPRWWGRPWAEVWQPVKINPNWFYAEHVLVDLGDGNLDGVNDIWCISWPYLLCYSGGERMDSLVDGLLDLRPGKTVLSTARLGDIDGSGRQAVAMSYDVAHSGASSFPGGIIFIVPSRAIPDSGTVRRLPHGTGRGSAGVEEPHPAGGQLHLSQRGE